MGLTASDDEQTITLRKALHVSGSVVDDETGKPIDVFRVVPGIVWGQGNPISWERDNSQSKSPHDGRTRLTTAKPGCSLTYAVPSKPMATFPTSKADSRSMTMMCTSISN